MPTQRTRLNPPWLRKWLIFGLVLFAFGCWGLYDAVYLYPKRGEEDVSYRLMVYLDALDKSGGLSAPGVPEPERALDELRPRRDTLTATANETTPAGRTALIDLARYEWLASLNRIWRLTPERTTAADPQLASPADTLRDLRALWQAKPKPEPLSEFDLGLQWLFFAIGMLGAAYFVWLIASRKGRKYTWDDQEKRLTLPDGRSFTPADIVEVDKRKWHKYYVTLGLADGARVTLDLYPHTPLEDWILEMERIAFPDTAETPESTPDSAPAAAESAEARAPDAPR